MKKFKKGVLAIGVLAAAAVIAAGCGKKDAKTTNETKKESAAESAVTEKNISRFLTYDGIKEEITAINISNKNGKIIL